MFSNFQTSARSDHFRRHLLDLRSDTYEGASDREDRVAIFEKAVELVSPVVNRVLGEFNEVMLKGTGELTHRVERDEEGGVWSRWMLSWPGQEQARVRTRTRIGEPREGPERIEPIIIFAYYKQDWTQAHLAGSSTAGTAGHWPFHVTSEEDAEQHAPAIWAIAEVELHRRTWDAHQAWTVVPLDTGDSPGPEVWAEGGRDPMSLADPPGGALTQVSGPFEAGS